MERAKGIEPSSTAWEAAALKIALEGRINKDNPNFKKFDQIISYYETRGTLSPFHLARIPGILKLFFKGNYHRYKDQEASWKAPYIAALGDLFE